MKTTCPGCENQEPARAECWLCEGDGTFDAPADTTERFVIDSEAKANWLLAKLGAIEAERERVKRQYAEMIGALERRAKALENRFKLELADWATAELQASGAKGKSLKLLQGTLSFRRVPGGLRVVDEAEAFRHAEASGMWTVTKVELDTVAYRRWASEAYFVAGKLAPGVEMIADRESFSIKF